MSSRSPTQKPTTEKKKRGNWAEQQALDYLKQHGLNVYQKNFQCKTGEIDLIMKDQDTLVFVEVRFRSDTRRGNPLETITISKQKKIIRTANFFLQQQYGDRWPICRFDVVGIIPAEHNIQKQHPAPEITWIKNAFF